MSEETKDTLITINIDGENVAVEPGTNIIEAAKKVGKTIPHYCYHPKLSVAGNCRMCLVEMGMPSRDRATGNPILDEDGNPKIMWSPKPAIACATQATLGMHIKTNSPMIKAAREGVLEFLLVNHPLDCPICDQAGECRLQEFASEHGRGYSRFIENKNVKPKRTRLGEHVILDDERCILCSRCIRFCNEVVKDPVIGFTDRGSYSTLTCFPGRQLNNNYSLNTVDICPVGALTSTDFRFKMRVWFLKETPSICPESSVGVNTVVSSREGVIYRIKPRRNDDVNDTWMADSGRFLYRQIDRENRMTNYSLQGKPINVRETIEFAGRLLDVGSVAFVGSSHNSVEEQWLLRMLAEACGNARVDLISHVVDEGGDGLLISADRAPNVRGALVTGLISKLPERQLTELAELIESGKIKTLVVYNEDVTQAGISRELLSKVELIYMGSHHNETSQCAKVEIPMLHVFEKAGTFINQQFRLQKFAQAIPGPEGVLNDLDLLRRLLSQRIEHDYIVPTIDEVWRLMSRSVPAFEGLTYATIPEMGVLLDATPYASLPFAEGPCLNFDPATVFKEEK